MLGGSTGLLLLGAVVGGTGPGVEALPCPNARAPWAGSIGPGASSFDMAVDAVGSIYVAGHFGDTNDFDPTDGVDERTANGWGMDIYLLKVNADGSYGWTYTVGAEGGTDSAASVAVTHDGAVLAVGGFQGTVDFDPTEGVDEHTAPGVVDGFLTKLATDGTYLWTLTFGSRDRAGVNRVAVDAGGNILLVGHCHGWLDLDLGPGRDLHPCWSDIFVIKLAPDTSYRWGHTFGGNAFDSGHGIATDVVGDVYVTGTFRETVDFDPGDGVDRYTARAPYDDIFITKFQTNGSYAWTRTYNASETRGIIAADPHGGAVITGFFKGRVDFDPTPGQTDWRIEYGGHADLFVTKLYADGSYAWTYTVGSLDTEMGFGVAIGQAANVLVAGAFNGPLDFDPGPDVDLHDATITGGAFVTKLRSDGSYLWTRSFGSGIDASASHVAVDPSGSVTVVGSYANFEGADFDPGCEVVERRAHIEYRSDKFITKLICPELSSDFDGDGDTDLFDFAAFQTCFTDEAPTTCNPGRSRLDLDPDDDIDLLDLSFFTRTLTGP